ncbi:MAG: hypothetical protein KGY75_08590 [Candidatus Cloacimonetes bacterium]|nr:hypothetical protein [Candidatus Cloacimonadota bacterium]MBS3768155.1 hypothetical protein [Candidatus Cloacimonadota bacterium]
MNPSNDKNYQLNAKSEFIINDYNSTKLFSSFFPGVAGKDGIPMWSFYVNRAQCLCSIGIKDKEHPIMEFLPANRAYQLVSSQGFRTFVKINKPNKVEFYEPFQNYPKDDRNDINQIMIITPYQLTLKEVNQNLGLKFVVQYSNAPNDDYAGLIRKLYIKNLNPHPISLDILDGLPLIIPYGIDNTGLKHIRRLIEAFVEVNNYKNNVPFFKSKVVPADRPEVVRIKKGNFYFGFIAGNNKPVPTIIDPTKIFGIRGDYNYPEKFLNNPIEELTENQIFENRLPCAMGLFNTKIEPQKQCTYNSLIGNINSLTKLNKLVTRIKKDGYIESKIKENRNIIQKLTQKNYICSSETVLDEYTRQNFLDNTLRGGLPYTLKGKKYSTTIHLYSRKHGDLERDYNHYLLNPTPYSQGNGNFRDVNQNRRCDLFFNPEVRAGNVEHFYNLIQMDGFNPLVIKEIHFTISEQEQLADILSNYLGAKYIKTVSSFLKNSFTPGELMAFLNENMIKVKGDPDEFLGNLFGICKKNFDTEYGEGFWTDHWTYNLDLLENYLSVYPENKKNIIFEKKTFTFYDNPYIVKSRDDKYVLWNGKPMQLNSVELDKEKEDLIDKRENDPNKVRIQFGKGEIFYTTLANKLLSLIANKLASLDAQGVGVEMETDKPNWYDALNGLPALMGSSINETIELKRHILYLLEAIEECKIEDDWYLFEEMEEFMQTMYKLLRNKLKPFEFWNKATSAKEDFRNKTRNGISGNEKVMQTKEVVDFLRYSLEKINTGIEKAWDNGKKVLSTYFANEVIDYEVIKTSNSADEKIIKRNEKGLPNIRAKKFRQKHLPLFMEGPVHYLRCDAKTKKGQTLPKKITKSGLFDAKLNMYKVNESLENQPPEIGRARTFSPGWFENESIWLHMEYKYMLELIRNEFYDEFFKNFKKVLVPFMKPEIYGRSILENSSFIVSSANPDPSLHGNGFVARLSGSTAEFIHIMSVMTIGEKPFAIDSKGNLQLSFNPVLPGWLFTKKPQKSRLFINNKWQEIELPPDAFSFMFLGSVLVIYHNDKRLDTFGTNSVSPVSWEVTELDGNTQTFQGETLTGVIVKKIRNGQVKKIEVELL